MPEAIVRRHKIFTCGLIVTLLLALPGDMLAQAGQRGAPVAGAPAAPGARGAAPVDLTGYWVSIVTEDWIERMAPDSPPSGVLRPATAGAAPAPANPELCRAYGAAGSLRVPGRLHVTWVDDNTLKIEMDAGTQTRLLHFNATAPPALEKTLQGYSVATWDVAGARGGRASWGGLRVVTTNLRGGYLLSSRSAYSENAVLTEYFTRHSDFGLDYFTVTATVEDGATTRITSSTFKKESDGSRFTPTGCEIVR